MYLPRSEQAKERAWRFLAQPLLTCTISLTPGNRCCFTMGIPGMWNCVFFLPTVKSYLMVPSGGMLGRIKSRSEVTQDQDHCIYQPDTAEIIY